MQRKKTLSLFIILYSLLFSPVGVHAQVAVGIKGGLQITQMEFNTDALRSSNRGGFFLGPTIKIGLPITGLSVDVSGLYDQRELKTDDRTFTQQSVLLPANMRFSAGLGDALSLFIAVGPQFSFNVGDDVIQWIRNEETHQFSLQETMLSINLGAGVTLANHLEGHIFYNIPISKTGDFTWDGLTDKLSEQTWHHAKSRTNAWRVSLTYYF